MTGCVTGTADTTGASVGHRVEIAARVLSLFRPYVGLYGMSSDINTGRSSSMDRCAATPTATDIRPSSSVTFGGSPFVMARGGVSGVLPEGRRVGRWGEDAPKRGAAWLAKMTSAPLVPVAIVGTEHSLAPGESAFRRTAVKIWVEKPLLWADYEGEPNPMVTMMADWYTAVDGRVQHWS